MEVNETRLSAAAEAVVQTAKNALREAAMQKEELRMALRVVTDVLAQSYDYRGESMETHHVRREALRVLRRTA